MKSLQISVGERFGRWTVTGPLVREKRGTGRAANYIARYPCRCDCGTTKTVRAFKLLTNSKSCGCLKRETLAIAMTVHGQNRPGRRTRLYRVWDGMRQRCGNTRHDSYARYGGRGISVCAAWDDFDTFREWAGSSGYRPSLQLDRIDNDGPYSPNNCRWVSEAVNKRNTSKTTHITAFGETKCLTDWAADPRCSVHVNTLRHRLFRRHQHPETAISTMASR